MKRLQSLIGLFLLLIGLPIAVFAADVSSARAIQEQKVAPPVKKSSVAVDGRTVLNTSVLTPLRDGKLSVVPVQSAERRKSMLKAEALTSTSALAGEYVITYKTLITTVADGGKGTTIKVTEDPDSIIIENFWDIGTSVKAKVDLEARTITIPNQIVGTTTNYGDIDIAGVGVSSTGTPVPLRDTPIEGVINEDGSITITSWWGIFVTSGTNADGYFGLYYNTLIEKANGKMSQKRLDTSTSPFSEIESVYNVVITQESANVVSVKNFANYGQTVDILLNRNETAKIESQLARNDVTNGDWYTYSIAYDAETGTLSSYGTEIVTEKASDKKEIVWKDWSLFNTGTTKYYAGILTEGKIVADFEISYPVLSVTALEGEGTEESPYLIKSLDDLVFIADQVNEIPAEEFTETAPSGSKYVRAYLGKHFKVVNNIDMSGYRFTPIGDDWNHYFAGIVDGNNCTISGLEVSTGAKGYAGLFGKADTLSVIKNLTLESPTITTEGYNAGSIVAFSLGTIENCHVKNATVTSSGNIAAGMAGIVNTIRNSTITNSTIKATSGYSGGMVGEVDKLIENCYATEVTLYAGAPAATYPAGGLVAQLYEGKALNCYFQGVVDGSSLRSSGLYIGGIAGSCYRGSIENCFFVGMVSCYDTSAANGGLVGSLYGDVLNCYSIGRVTGVSTKQAGGLIGVVKAYTTADGVTAQSSVKNSYTSTVVSAETYLYDPQTEVREIIGTIAEGATPTIENIYFDNQLTNFSSIKYGVPAAELTKAAGPDGFDASVWNFTEGYYPRIKGIDENEAAYMSASAIALQPGNTVNKVAQDTELKPLGATQYYLYKEGNLSKEGHFSKITESNVLDIDMLFGTDTLYVVNGKNAYYHFLKIAPALFEGEGTVDNPYLIKTKEDLITLSEVTTNVKQYYNETYFLMVNDIDLQHDPAFLGICTDADDAHCQFAGIFDGGGHTIHNMYINAVVWETTPEEDTTYGGSPNTKESKGYKGFVGRLGATGVVKNLNIAADAQIFAFATTGAIVGYNYGVVDNCKNYADITGISCWIGGIVAQNLATGVVTNCYNAGNITSGYMQAGGVVANNAGIIENCANVGDIAVKSISAFNKPGSTKLNLAGGIQASTNGGVVKNCLNAGTVYAEYSKAGGISGALTKATSTNAAGTSDVINSINYGQVFTADQALIGAIGGDKGTEGIVENVYWDAQILPLLANGNAELAGTTGVETSVLTSGTALENYSADLWQFDKGQYPVLKQFANEEKLSYARKTIVNIPTGVTAKDLSADATLVEDTNCTWSLTQGTVFKIEGNTLKAPAEVESLEVDTLVVTYISYVKPIVISRTPAVPLEGEGTSENPYLIKTTDDWNNLATYISSVGDDLEGKYLSVANDIDFTNAEFKMLAGDGVTNLQATLNGNGKTISGIAYTTTATYEAAIGVLGEKGTINDLTLAGEINSAYANTGAFIAKVYGKLNNCVNNINLTSTKGSGAAGFGAIFSGAVLTDCVNKATISGKGTNIAGIASTTEDVVEFIRCGNEGKIVNAAKSNYTAGLVGTAYPSKYVECYNIGTIELSTPESTANVGGLIGYANASASSEGDYELTKCYNTASISGMGVLGGIIASANASSSIVNPIIMTDCYNTGDISSVATSAKSGNPIAGIIALYTPGSKFERCYNTGTILSQKNVYAAGLLGYYKTAANAETPVLVTNCYNEGAIVASGNQGGGIIAYCNNYVTVEYCYNEGTVEGGFGLGGIAGCLSGTMSKIENCWNLADITTTTNRAGGIIGYNSTLATVSNCFNLGNVSSTSETAGTTASSGYGIAGIAGTGGSIFTNCYNMGTITGASRVGGIIGAPTKAKTQIVRCYNAGEIVAEPDTCGNLIGVNLNNSAIWTEGNAITDSYYVTDYISTPNDTIGTEPVANTTTLLGLASVEMGEGWNNGDSYTLPMIATLSDIDAAVVQAAQLVVAEGDTYESVTQNFFVGNPEGITWSSSIENVTVSGTDAIFSDAEYVGDLVMTATCGEYEKQVILKVNKPSGVAENLAEKEIVGEVYYNVSGVKVPKPIDKDNQVYLIVKSYSDGSKKVEKLINK